jgi:two-component system phosphate regulon response regulator OmpR
MPHPIRDLDRPERKCMKAPNPQPNIAARGRTSAAHLQRRAPSAPRCTINDAEAPRLTATVWLMGEAGELVKPLPAERETNDDGADASVPRVLLIDKDQDSAKLLSALLTPEAQVIHAATLVEAKQLLRTELFALVIMDPTLPDGNAASLMPLIIATPVLVHAVREPVWRDAVAGYLPKPWTSQRRLWNTISRLLGVPTTMSAGD